MTPLGNTVGWLIDQTCITKIYRSLRVPTQCHPQNKALLGGFLRDYGGQQAVHKALFPGGGSIAGCPTDVNFNCG